VPNLKFVSLAILELLAFNEQQFTGSCDPGHAHPLLTFRVWRHRRTSFEAMNRYNQSTDKPEKYFNTPTENALCRCQFGVKWGKNKGYL